MKCWSSILWYAAGLLLLDALGGVCEAKKPKYCKRARRPPQNKTDYCAVASCSVENLGCKHNQKFAKDCDGKMSTVSKSTRDLIVKQHNVYRNIVAKGQLHGLPPSGRMLKMQWHEELAEIARFAAYRCSIGPIHRCFATQEYPAPGYNMAFNKHSGGEDRTKIVRAQLKVWYEQYQYANAQSMISGKSPGGQEIGHFLQMISGLSDRIGCAISKAKHSGYTYQTLICAYSCAKSKKQPVYKISRIPAEDCVCGSDPDFKNLCSGFERVMSCEAAKPSTNQTLIGLDYDWNGHKIKSNASDPVEKVIDFIQDDGE